MVPIPATQVRLSPPGEGLVGMSTWLWFADPGELVVPVNLNGWSGQARAHVARYDWAVGQDADGTGGEDHVTSSTPGDAGHPSATYVYHRHCACTVSVTAWWTGTYTVTEPAGTSVTIDLGQHAVTAAAAYPVKQLQAVITSG